MFSNQYSCQPNLTWLKYELPKSESAFSLFSTIWASQLLAFGCPGALLIVCKELLSLKKLYVMVRHYYSAGKGHFFKFSLRPPQMATTVADAVVATIILIAGFGCTSNKSPFQTFKKLLTDKSILRGWKRANLHL